MAETLPFTLSKDGVRVFLRVTPNAGDDQIGDVGQAADGRVFLKVRVRAVADKGQANKAVIGLLAKAWHLPKTRLSVVVGATDRNKTLLVAGDAPVTEAILRDWFVAHLKRFA